MGCELVGLGKKRRRLKRLRFYGVYIYTKTFGFLLPKVISESSQVTQVNYDGHTVLDLSIGIQALVLVERFPLKPNLRDTPSSCFYRPF